MGYCLAVMNLPVPPLLHVSCVRTGFQLGQQVNHNVYGEGVILNFEGNGPRARVHVRFEQAGTKILILASANLAAI